MLLWPLHALVSFLLLHTFRQTRRRERKKNAERSTRSCEGATKSHSLHNPHHSLPLTLLPPLSLILLPLLTSLHRIQRHPTRPETLPLVLQDRRRHISPFHRLPHLRIFRRLASDPPSPLRRLPPEEPVPSPSRQLGDAVRAKSARLDGGRCAYLPSRTERWCCGEAWLRVPEGVVSDGVYASRRFDSA